MLLNCGVAEDSFGVQGDQSQRKSTLWSARRSIPKEINPEYSLEGLMLKLQDFGHLMQKADSLEKILLLGKTEGRREGDDREWDGWLASPTQWTWIWAKSRKEWWAGKPGVLPGVAKSWTWFSNWTTSPVCPPLLRWSVYSLPLCVSGACSP